jgi:glycosyltransferase involved in cell wall biosynthesis
MKLLYITYHYIDGYGGGVIGTKAYINAFAELSDEITLLYPVKGNSVVEGLNPKVKATPLRNDRSRFKKGLDLLTGRSNPFRLLTNYADKQRFDTVVFDTCMVSHGLIGHFKRQGIRIITVHHNYQYEFFRDNSKALLRLPTLFWVRRFEREAVRMSDLNITLTEEDLQSLKKYYGTGTERFEAVGSFEDTRQSHPVYPSVDEPRFLITGGLNDMQTEKSLLFWIEHYFPILKEQFPAASLTIAGRSPSNKLLDLAARHGIRVIPSPESMEPILAAAKYYICPTFLGSGKKMRILDGLSHGLPVICHSVSARGYGSFVKSGAVLEYNDLASFRLALQKLKNLDLDREDTIRLYENELAFDRGKERLANALKTIIK